MRVQGLAVALLVNPKCCKIATHPPRAPWQVLYLGLGCWAQEGQGARKEWRILQVAEESQRGTTLFLEKRAQETKRAVKRRHAGRQGHNSAGCHVRRVAREIPGLEEAADKTCEGNDIRNSATFCNRLSPTVQLPKHRAETRDDVVVCRGDKWLAVLIQVDRRKSKTPTTFHENKTTHQRK